ncbi:hypothetical protein NCS52_01529500 [Fusarium sp. LHS14.1]|nr:hypothetical protein NCS52_01529500 [Fusarium sp. LHS14.1]
MTESSEKNIKIILICCTIFIFIENLHRRYADSAHHLRASYQLLESFREAIRSREATPYGSMSQGEITSEHTMLNILAKIFESLNQNVAMFTGDECFSRTIHQSREPQIGHPETPFSNLDEAEDSLSSLNTFYDSFLIN